MPAASMRAAQQATRLRCASSPPRLLARRRLRAAGASGGGGQGEAPLLLGLGAEVGHAGDEYRLCGSRRHGSPRPRADSGSRSCSSARRAFVGARRAAQPAGRIGLDRAHLAAQPAQVDRRAMQPHHDGRQAGDLAASSDWPAPRAGRRWTSRRAPAAGSRCRHAARAGTGRPRRRCPPCQQRGMRQRAGEKLALHGASAWRRRHGATPRRCRVRARAPARGGVTQFVATRARRDQQCRRAHRRAGPPGGHRLRCGAPGTGRGASPAPARRPGRVGRAHAAARASPAQARIGPRPASGARRRSHSKAASAAHTSASTATSHHASSCIAFGLRSGIVPRTAGLREVVELGAQRLLTVRTSRA